MIDKKVSEYGKEMPQLHTTNQTICTNSKNNMNNRSFWPGLNLVSTDTCVRVAGHVCALPVSVHSVCEFSCGDLQFFMPV